MLGGIENAILARDHEGLRLAAHKLKGAVGNLGAAAAADAALRLERMGQGADLTDAKPRYVELEREIGVMEQALRKLARPARARGTGRPRGSRPRARRPVTGAKAGRKRGRSR